MAEEIIVDIHPDGKISMEAKGFRGKQCEVLMSELEESLGKVVNIKLKPEYHEKVTHGETIRGR